MVADEKSLLEVEMNIRIALQQCSFWGELPITRNEYEILCEKIRSKVKEEESTPQTIEKLFKMYPCCMVTSMVFYFVFEYSEEFWSPWGDKMDLKLSVNHYSIIGKKMLDILNKTRMNKYEEGGYKYLTPLLCQAGVPDRKMGDIFYAITTSNTFDAHEIIAEFKGWKATYINKALEHFICFHEDKALDLVVLVHDVMLNSDVMDSESYEGRIFEQYSKWKEENVNKKGKFEGKGAFQENPHLVMDEEKGLCMALPEFILEDEYCDYIKWEIEADKEILYSLECGVINDGNSKHSREKIVPIPARDNYIVSTYDSDNLEDVKYLKDWEVTGLAEKGFLLFENNGKRRKDDMFLHDGGTLLVSDEVKYRKFSDVEEIETEYPNNEGVKIYNFVPLKGSAEIQMSRSKLISA